MSSIEDIAESLKNIITSSEVVKKFLIYRNIYNDNCFDMLLKITDLNRHKTLTLHDFIVVKDLLEEFINFNHTIVNVRYDKREVISIIMKKFLIALSKEKIDIEKEDDVKNNILIINLMRQYKDAATFDVKICIESLKKNWYIEMIKEKWFNDE